MQRRQFMAGLAGAAGSLALSSPLSAAPLAKVRELGVLRVGLYTDNRPWSWDAAGNVSGIDADIARAIAERLGLRVDLALFPADEEVSDDLRNVVWRGGLLGFMPCDVMLHVPFDMQFAKKEDQVVFVAPYYRENFGMVCSGDAQDCEAPLPQFKGKRLAAELDSIPDFYLIGSFGGILRSDVSHHSTGYGAAQAVQAGDADMAVATRAQIEAAMSDAPNAYSKKRKGPLTALPSAGWDIGMAVKENSRSLGFAIEDIVGEMSTDGQMEAIFATHGVSWHQALAAKPIS